MNKYPKSCPFCGGKARVETSEPDPEQGVGIFPDLKRVACTICGIATRWYQWNSGYRPGVTAEMAAREDWDQRVPLPKKE